MFTKTFFAAVFAAVAAAQSNADNPTIAPATGEVVPGCKPYTLSWTPTTDGTVSIEIISGASQGTLVPVGTVASGIANSGSFSWTPAAALGENAVTGYKIIVDASGQFQYSVPFSVSPCTPDEPTSTPPTSIPVPTKEGYPTTAETTAPVYPTTTPVIPSSSCTTTSTVYVNPPAGTGYPHVPSGPGYNTTGPYPVNPPSTLYPTATGTGSGVYPTGAPAPPEFTGAASAVKAGLSFAGAAAAFVFML